MHGNLGSLQAATDIVRCPVFPPNMMLLQQVLQCKLAPVRYCNDRNVRILKCARIRASMEEPSGNGCIATGTVFVYRTLSMLQVLPGSARPSAEVLVTTRRIASPVLVC